MDYKKERGLFSKCCDAYDSAGMAGFEKWVDEPFFDDDEKKYLVELREVLRIANNTGISKIPILPRDSSRQTIINDLTFQSIHCEADKGGRYLKIKLEEFFAKRERGELQ